MTDESFGIAWAPRRGLSPTEIRRLGRIIENPRGVSQRQAISIANQLTHETTGCIGHYEEIRLTQEEL